jgi:pimeloyl-ACP methyl ester carboxylesterase
MTQPQSPPHGFGGIVSRNYGQLLLRVGAMLVLLAPTLNLVSCATSQLPASAKLEHPVIFVPGMPGSVLKSSEDGEVLWGRFDFGPNHAPDEGGRLALALQPEGQSKGNGNVVPGGVLDRMEVTFLGMPTRWHIYAPFMRRLTAMEPSPERGKYFHSFAYDWRLDCAENARLLHRFMEKTAGEMRRDFPEQFGSDEEVRFDIVAHSMGSLLTRYALCYGDVPLETALQRKGAPWQSSGRCRKFIMINPPNGGSLRSFERLIRGYTYGPMLPEWGSAVLGTLPSLYQLLPPEKGVIEVRSEGGRELVSLLDVRAWEEQGWGMFAPEAKEDLEWLVPGLTGKERDAQVQRHVGACLDRAADFRAALDGSSPPPSEIQCNLLIGAAKPTPCRAQFDKESRTFKTIRREPGDSLITLNSSLAVPGLRNPSAWHSVYFGRRDHITAIAHHDWINRIARLLVNGLPAGSDNEPGWARGFFDRSLR